MAPKKAKTLAVEVVAEDASTALEALSPDEKQALRRHENIIKRGWDTFVDVGNALAEIQKARLYRAKYRTFAAYCRNRWQYGKSQAYRLMGAAEVVAHLSPIGDNLPKPLNEAQVRPLIGLSPEDQVKAWKAAVEEAAGKSVTAQLVRRAAEPFVASPRKRGAKARRKPSLQSAALAAVKSALSALADNDPKRAQSTLEELQELLSASKATS